MASGIFQIRAEGELVELSPSAHAREADFQELLARYPGLIPGRQIDPVEPRRWLLVTREAGIPSEPDGGSRWSIDHLLLDQDGVPTFVEVKRSADTRIRREVVGQMLDYAANAVVHWSVEHLQATLGRRCEREGLTVEQALSDVLGPDPDVEGFWDAVKRNLQASRIRLVFVADEIPAELRRVVEFLNRHMDPVEVLAVEIRRYVGEGGHETLVPQVLGQTEQARSRKAAAVDAELPRWTEARFFEVLEERRGAAEAAVARQLLDWMVAGQGRVLYGRGVEDGSILWFVPHATGQRSEPSPFGIWTSGKIELHFQYLRYYAPFDAEEARRELLARVNAIPGINLTEAALTRRPGVQLRQLLAPDAMRQFVATFGWVAERLATGR